MVRNKDRNKNIFPLPSPSSQGQRHFFLPAASIASLPEEVEGNQGWGSQSVHNILSLLLLPPSHFSLASASSPSYVMKSFTNSSCMYPSHVLEFPSCSSMAPFHGIESSETDSSNVGPTSHSSCQKSCCCMGSSPQPQGPASTLLWCGLFFSPGHIHLLQWRFFHGLQGNTWFAPGALPLPPPSLTLVSAELFIFVLCSDFYPFPKYYHRGTKSILGGLSFDQQWFC